MCDEHSHDPNPAFDSPAHHMCDEHSHDPNPAFDSPAHHMCDEHSHDPNLTFDSPAPLLSSRWKCVPNVQCIVRRFVSPASLNTTNVPRLKSQHSTVTFCTDVPQWSVL